MSAYLTASDVADRLGFHPKTIRLWCKRGVFPGATKYPNNHKTSHWVIPSADVAALESSRARTADVSSDRITELMDAIFAKNGGADLLESLTTTHTNSKKGSQK